MPSSNGANAGTATSSPTRTEQIRSRLLAGEQLDSSSMAAEYDISRGMFTHLVRDLKAQGHVFDEIKTSPTEPVKYQLVTKQENTSATDPRSGYERVSEALLAGEHLRGADLTEQGLKPQLLSVTIAQLKALGYLFDHEDTEDGKVWFVTGKGEPQPRKKHTKHEFTCPESDCDFETSNAGGFGSHLAAHRRGTGEPQPRVKRRSTGVPRSAHISDSRIKNGGSRPKMPAPELDAQTDITLVHRISPDEVEVAFRQGSRQWLVAVRSCIED